jgi:hypothetical protein
MTCKRKKVEIPRLNNEEHQKIKNKNKSKTTETGNKKATLSKE